jgi:hypothetical protein
MCKTGDRITVQCRKRHAIAGSREGPCCTKSPRARGGKAIGWPLALPLGGHHRGATRASAQPLDDLRALFGPIELPQQQPDGDRIRRKRRRFVNVKASPQFAV